MTYCGPNGVRTVGGRISYAAQLRKTRQGREEPCGGRPRPLAMSVALLLLRASPAKYGVPLDTKFSPNGAGFRRPFFYQRSAHCRLCSRSLNDALTWPFLHWRRCPVKNGGLQLSLLAQLPPRCHAEAWANGDGNHGQTHKRHHAHRPPATQLAGLERSRLCKYSVHTIMDEWPARPACTPSPCISVTTRMEIRTP